MQSLIYQISKLIEMAKACDMPVTVIGNGSNLLVGDKASILFHKKAWRSGQKGEAFAMWFVYALGSAVFAALTSDSG